MASIGQHFRDVVARQPDAIAIVDGGERIRYSQLEARQTAFARLLRDRWNLAPGDVVAVSLPNCWEFVACFLAVTGSGAVFLPLNTNWRASELGWFARTLPLSGVVTAGELSQVWRDAGSPATSVRTLTIDDPATRAELRRDDTVAAPAVPAAGELADRPAVYEPTSGTTGRPKLVPQTHRSLLASARNVAAGTDIRAGDRFLVALPLYFAYGIGHCLMLSLMNGGQMVMQSKFVPVQVARSIQAERIQVVIMSPVMWKLLAARELRADMLSAVRIAMTGGAAIPAGLGDQCRERLGIHLRNSYGATETGHVATQPPAGEIRSDPRAMDLVPEVEVRVVASDGRPLPAGEVGEILVRSPSMMRGYLNEPRLTAEAMCDGFFRMGDFGFLDADGRLVVVGRKKRLINRGGVKVDPAEVEDVIRTMPGIVKCRVLSSEDSLGAETVRAVIAAPPEAGISREGIVEHCRRHLAEYKVPQLVELVDELPVDLLGKS